MNDLLAKFRVFEVADIKGLDNKVFQQRVKLVAVTGDSEVNKTWAKATPYGNLEMIIDNPGAFDILTYGKEVILTFSIAK